MNTLLRFLLIMFIADKAINRKKKPQKKSYRQKQNLKVKKVKGQATFTEDINLN